MSSSLQSSDFVLRYPFSSRLMTVAQDSQLELATARTAESFPHLFEGRLLKPRIAASLLATLPRLAMTRFHVPPNMLAQILASADPVVTCNRDILRLESFSACGSAYARMDIISEACDGKFLGRGTTNVDFQQNLRDALNSITADRELRLSVGLSEVKLAIDKEDFIERKVQLPTRWLRGFAEVAACQAKLELIHDVKKVPSVRFLQNLPANPNDKADYYLKMRGGELSLTQQKLTDSVKIDGLARLRMLKPLASHIDGIRIFADSTGGTSSWLVTAGPYILEFVVSASPYRGFSGEGQLLEDLVRSECDTFLPRVRAALNWQTRINVAEIAEELDTTSDIIKTCLSKMASSGLVGYDSSCGDYYHRELPLKPSRTLALNPRLQGAKRIVDGQRIEIVQSTDEFTEAQVTGSGVTHIVRVTQRRSTCTCVWYAKHQGERGPCKHILSLQILMESTDGK